MKKSFHAALILVLSIGAFFSAPVGAARAETDAPRWRLDAGYMQSRFSRADRADWREEYGEITRQLDTATSFGVRMDVSKRYGKYDTALGARLTHRFDPALDGYAFVYGTPDADFLARWAMEAGGNLKVRQGDAAFGPTLLLLTLRHKDYASGDSENIDPGLMQYLADGRVWLTGKWINTFERGPGKRLGGYAFRGDWQMLDNARLFAGYAFAPETDSGTVVHVRSRFAGLVYDLDDATTLRLDLLGEDREGSYLRNVFSLGVSRRF